MKTSNRCRKCGKCFYTLEDMLWHRKSDLKSCYTDKWMVDKRGFRQTDSGLWRTSLAEG